MKYLVFAFLLLGCEREVIFDSSKPEEKCASTCEEKYTSTCIELDESGAIFVDGKELTIPDYTKLKKVLKAAYEQKPEVNKGMSHWVYVHIWLPIGTDNIFDGTELYGLNFHDGDLDLAFHTDDGKSHALYKWKVPFLVQEAIIAKLEGNYKPPTPPKPIYPKL